MVITCDIMGGLGNQFFQIMTLISLAKRENLKYVLPNVKELQRNNKETKRNTYWTNIFDTLSDHLKDNIMMNNPEYIKEKEFAYNPIIVNNKSKDIILHGYFQSYKYFDKNMVLEELNIQYKKHAILQKYGLNLGNKTAIHFRMGDYKKVSHIHNILNLDYYIKAINKIKNTKEFVYFYDKSDKDDIETIHNTIETLTIIYPKYSFIEMKNDLEDWEELLLMSCFKNNIIANSTFSWWAAYLNTNMNHNVYYPEKWFADSLINTVDLFPQKWIKVG